MDRLGRFNLAQVEVAAFRSKKKINFSRCWRSWCVILLEKGDTMSRTGLFKPGSVEFKPGFILGN